MIGGIVVHRRFRKGLIALKCVEYRWRFDKREPTGSKAFVYIDCYGDIPSVGDEIWWQSDTVYWTPADRRFIDRPLNRMSHFI